MNDIKSTAQLLSKLRNILLKQRLVMFTAGIFGTLAAMLVISIILSALANLTVLPVWLKISLIALAGLITLGGWQGGTKRAACKPARGGRCIVL